MSADQDTREVYLTELAEAIEIWVQQDVTVVPTGGYPPDMASNQTLLKGWPTHPIRSAVDFWSRVNSPTSDFEVRGIAAVHGQDAGSFALDMDGDEGRRHFHWLERHGLVRPDELVIDSPNGVHIVMGRGEEMLAMRYPRSADCSGCVVIGGGFKGPEGDGRLHLTMRGKRGPQVTKLPPSRRPITGERYIARRGWSWEPLPLWLWFEGEARPEPKRLTVAPDPGSKTAYGLSAFRGELDAVLHTHKGARNERLNEAAFNLGTLVAVGVLDGRAVSDGLFIAAETIGLVHDDGEASVRATIRSGLDAGQRHPRTVTA